MDETPAARPAPVPALMPGRLPGRWEVIRDALVFQFKVFLDGARDVLLSPVSLIAVLLGLFMRPDNPGVYFYRVLRLGLISERWINLFGAVAHDRQNQPPAAASNVDTLVDNLETAVRQRHARGGWIARIKRIVDWSLDRLHIRRGLDRRG